MGFQLSDRYVHSHCDDFLPPKNEFRIRFSGWFTREKGEGGNEGDSSSGLGGIVRIAGISDGSRAITPPWPCSAAY